MKVIRQYELRCCGVTVAKIFSDKVPTIFDFSYVPQPGMSYDIEEVSAAIDPEDRCQGPRKIKDDIVIIEDDGYTD